MADSNRENQQRLQNKARTLHPSAHPSTANRHIAVLRLHLADGTVLHHQLLTLDTAGHILSFTALDQETAFCEWFRGDWYSTDV